MARHFIPTGHNADPHRIIVSNSFFPFIENVVESAIELADPQDGVEDNIEAFLEMHREDLDSTFNALVSMFRHLAIPLERSHGNSSNSNPTLGIIHATSNHVANSPPGTQVNGVSGSVRHPTTNTHTSENGSDDNSHHGNGAPQVSNLSWVEEWRMREASRRAAAQTQTTTMTAPLHQNGVQDATHLNGNGILPTTTASLHQNGVQDATNLNGNGIHPTATALLHQNGVQNATHVYGNGTNPTTSEESDESSEDDESLLPQTTYTPPTVPQRRGAQTSFNTYSINYATEESSDDSLESTNDSVTATTDAALTQHVFQLPMVIDGDSQARLRTATGRHLPRFGNSLGQRGRRLSEMDLELASRHKVWNRLCKGDAGVQLFHQSMMYHQVAAKDSARIEVVDPTMFCSNAYKVVYRRSGP
jgi:hypothetical protein